jgi:hypothetical protein
MPSPGSPDLNPRNFFLLSYIKSVMYGCTDRAGSQLKEWITVAVDKSNFRDKLNPVQIYRAMKGMHVEIY